MVSFDWKMEYAYRALRQTHEDRYFAFAFVTMEISSHIP